MIGALQFLWRVCPCLRCRFRRCIRYAHAIPYVRDDRRRIRAAMRAGEIPYPPSEWVSDWSPEEARRLNRLKAPKLYWDALARRNP